MSIDKRKYILFVAAIFLPVFSFAERISIDAGDGRVRYVQEDLLRFVAWSDDTSLISRWSGNASDSSSVDGLKLGDKNNRYGCKIIAGREPAQNPYLNLYLKFRESNKDFGVYLEYPDGYTCDPTNKEITEAIARKVKEIKDSTSELDAQIEGDKLASGAGKKVEFGGYVATKKDIFGSVLLACYTGSLDREGMLYVSKEEQANRYKALLDLYEGEPSSIKRITNAYNFARRNLSDRYPLDTQGQYRAGVCDQMVVQGKL
ncbi:hypothetical protein M1M11_30420 [Pseudomonas azerbaijanoccidens]|uniref:hypothetical protein n=1 Tax=Pseudomonas azerbaijanoccidentalis TaxID=2842347 RepID=UPI00200B2E1F|nr:hypothetical protein [Pseudomonas azerbaijanoccidentalis]MCK8669198.1 hypothetical protein [Pseudomonas azerbaijanoccidentalis]